MCGSDGLRTFGVPGKAQRSCQEQEATSGMEHRLNVAQQKLKCMVDQSGADGETDR
jgi:hypothetical protein